MARWMFVALMALSLATVCIAQDTAITYQGVVSNTYNGAQLTWTTAIVQGTNVDGTGTASIEFGLAMPKEYQADTDQVYPLVLYLHGAGARGSNISQVLNRATACHFAWQAQEIPEYGAFVVAPQVPSSHKWAETPWENGPYVQSEATHTDSMCLTVNLIRYMVDSNNNVALAAVLGIDANDIDATRLYVVGDSMGAYGTWDIIAREPELFAAAIAASGSGPKNKLEEIRQTPFWVIHGEVDSTVPNRLPTANNPDGDGSLGMLALLDPAFNNTKSTDIVCLDDYSTREDDPNIWNPLVYTEFPAGFNHSTVATQWTTLMSGTSEWLFAHPITEKHMPKVGPLENLQAV